MKDRIDASLGVLAASPILAVTVYGPRAVPG